MGSIGCPLCCRHDFISVVALHDHLLYYVYRPLQCAVCSIHVGGIQELTHHLERHLGDDISTATHQPKAASDQPGNSSIREQHNLNFYSSHDKSGWKKWGENSNSMTSGTREEPIELTLRAYFCQTCGAKVVGKDAYFSHIKQHNSRPSSSDVPSLATSSCFQEVSSPTWKEGGGLSSPNVASVNSTPVNVTTDSETVTSEETHEVARPPETELSGCEEESHVANQLLKLREWQLGKHGRRFRKHQLSFSSSPRPSNQSPLSEKLLCSTSPSTIIDPGSMEMQPLSQSSGPTSVEKALGNIDPPLSLFGPSVATGFSVDPSTTEVFKEISMLSTMNTPIEEQSRVEEYANNHTVTVPDASSIPPCISLDKKQVEVALPAVEEAVPLDDCIVSPLDNGCVDDCFAVSPSFPATFVNIDDVPVPDVPIPDVPVPDVPVPTTATAEDKTGSSVFPSNSWISPHHPVYGLELDSLTKEGPQLISDTPSFNTANQSLESSSQREFLFTNKSTVSSSSDVPNSQEYIGDVPTYTNLELTDSLSHNAHVSAYSNPELSDSVLHDYQPPSTYVDKYGHFDPCSNDDVQRKNSTSEGLPLKESVPASDSIQNASSEIDDNQHTNCEYPHNSAGSDNVSSDPDTKTRSGADNYNGQVVDSRPYLHKKFHHDQERKIVPAVGISQNADVSRYIHSFQSMLVSKLNGTLSTDLPFKSEGLCLESNKNNKRDNVTNEHLPVRQTLPSEYICEVCSLQCTSRSAYKAHYKVHEAEGQKNFKCQYCDKKFFKKRTKDLHLRKHTGEKVHRCEQCPQVFTKLYTFLRHQREVHAIKKSFMCAECTKAFSSQRQLENHIGVHQTEKYHKCNDCDHACHTASGLRTHKLEVHSNVQSREHHCEMCNEHFKKQSGLKRHIQRKHSQQKLPCDLCSKVYSCSEDLLQHRKTHDSEPLKCDHCDKAFASSWCLQRHSVIHGSSSHPYKCNKCSMTFTRADSLACHLKLHAQKKSHVCNCGKRFVKKSQLKVHEDKHSEVPKHTCSTCNRAFKFKISLKNHSCKASAVTEQEKQNSTLS